MTARTPDRPAGGALPTSYFDRMYERADDPWEFDGRWYERRKRAITLASLPRERFRRAFEPGCSVGVLSAELAARCDELLATDVSDHAVTAAGRRLEAFPRSRAQVLRVPEDWPAGEFDLVVLSEVAYYCDAAGALELGRRAAGSLSRDGVLLTCHWRHPVEDYPLGGDEADDLVGRGSGFSTLAEHRETDFLLRVRVPDGTPSVAAAESLPGADRPRMDA